MNLLLQKYRSSLFWVALTFNLIFSLLLAECQNKKESEKTQKPHFSKIHK